MYYFTNTEEIYFSRKARKLEIHTIYNRYKNAWHKLGTYTTKQITNAINEGTLTVISRRQANTLIQTGQYKG